MDNVRSQRRRLHDGPVVYVAQVLVVIQYSVLVVRSGKKCSVRPISIVAKRLDASRCHLVWR